jgi:hypothetical protein
MVKISLTGAALALLLLVHPTAARADEPTKNPVRTPAAEAAPVPAPDCQKSAEPWTSAPTPEGPEKKPLSGPGDPDCLAGCQADHEACIADGNPPADCLALARACVRHCRP